MNLVYPPSIFPYPNKRKSPPMMSNDEYYIIEGEIGLPPVTALDYK